MDQSKEIEREVKRCCRIAVLLGLVPIVELVFLQRMESTALSVALVIWVAACVIGLLFSVRAVRLAKQSTSLERFSLFVCVAHVFALLLLGAGYVLAAAGN